MPDKTENTPVETGERRGELAPTPWEPLARLRVEMDRLFDEFSAGWPFGRARSRGRSMLEPPPFSSVLDPFRAMASGWAGGVAALEVIDKETAIEVRVELPGMDEKDIEVRLADGLLTISGEKKEEKTEGESEGPYSVSERRYGAFQRSLRIPQGVDAERVGAAFKKGVLIVTLPKTEEAKERVKKIEVKGEA